MKGSHIFTLLPIKMIQAKLFWSSDSYHMYLPVFRMIDSHRLQAKFRCSDQIFQTILFPAAGTGNAEPDDQCALGYYCPGGQERARPDGLACSPGHFCQEGSHNETGCPSGWYQQHWARYDCNLCPRGAFCRAYGERRAGSLSELDRKPRPVDRFRFGRLC